MINKNRKRTLRKIMIYIFEEINNRCYQMFADKPASKGVYM